MEGFNDEMQFCVFIPHMELTAGGRPSPGPAARVTRVPPVARILPIRCWNTALAGGAPYTEAGSRNYNLINAIRHGHWTLSLVVVMIQWRYGDLAHPVTSGPVTLPLTLHTPYTAVMSPLIAFNV